jgi:PAS domain S-box-containing protein
MAARLPVGRGWHLSGWQTLLFALAALAIASGAWFAWREARFAATAVGWVQHTFSVLIESDQLLAAVADAETGQRGFLLTGDRSYLEPYDQALPRVAPRFEALRKATADVPSAQRRLAEIEPLVREKLAEFAETIRRARTGEPEAALALVRSDVGKELMDEIRRGIGEIRSDEHEQLRERIAARDAYLRSTRSYALILGALSLGFSGVLIASINRTMGARRAAEWSARESEQRLRITLESIGDAVIATDVVGRVTYMNPVAEALTGWRRADAQELPLDQVFRIVNEFSRDIVESPVSKVMREGGVVGLANHTLLIARDGSERPIDDSGAPIRDGDGGLMGVALVFRDVTARRLSEQARERLLRAEAERESAEGASRAKDEFLAVVSHELRSPLTAALSWVELLKGDALGEGQRVRALDTIERNLRHQSVLVSDLLDVSRIVAGKLWLERVPTDVATLVRDAVNDHRALAESAAVSLRHEASRPIIALADPARIRQVISNLLSNAIRFTPPGGQVEVILAGDDGAVDISVRDTGRGIPAPLLPYVFERFRQGPPASVREHGGLGLGLAIARHLVEGHGGTIEAHSKGEGRGATFRVCFPLQDLTAVAPPSLQAGGARAESRGADGRLRGATVLLVEDHADTRDALEHLLRLHGARVLCASSAAEALDLVRNERPSLVVSDLGLPHESGLALIERLRVLDAECGARTPAIAASGFASAEDRQAALAAGFDAYLAKPIELSKLLAQIASLLAR